MTKPGPAASIIAALLIGGAVAAFAIAWRPAIAAIDPPAPQSFDAALVRHGRELAAIGNCSIATPCAAARILPAGCRCRRRSARSIPRTSRRTPRPGSAAGRKLRSAAPCATGVDRDGQHLYPTFPYDHFTNVSDEDDRALYAYLMTREPVAAPARANQLPFPLDQRFVIAGWKLLFLRRGTYRPDATRARNGIAAPIWSKGWRIAAPAIPRAMRSARNGRARVCRRRRRQLARLCDQRAVAGAGAVGRGRAVFLSCATAGIPITASRAGRWRRW